MLKFITNNLGWKLLSVALAAIVWMAADYAMRRPPSPATVAGTARRTFANLPITILTTANDPRHYVVEPAQVRATFRGPPEVIERLRPGDISVFVNLTGIRDARELRKNIEVLAPPGVTLVSLMPSEVLVRTDLTMPATNAPPIEPSSP
ncbi:MAG: hypothetical protein D6766_04385 [Verrucomicrobia bacterium]|nr:MAG: hypothetical protein D6766_04385 [Verrucomicrobiota bacterium]